MKTKQLLIAVLFSMASFGLLTAQELDHHELAKKVLKNTYNIQPGNVVVINGGQHTLDMLEAFVIEAERMGAVPVTRINTDKITKSYYENVPEKYYGIGDQYFIDWLKLIDVWINLPWLEDSKKIYENIPEEKIAKINKSGQEFDKALNESKIIGGNINFPTKNAAANSKIDFNTYKNMQWKAINADYTKIAQNAKKIEKLLKNSKKVEIITMAGTKLNFSVTGRECTIGDGVVDEKNKKSKMFIHRWNNLPSGFIYISAEETSGNGKVVVPKTSWKYQPLTDVTFEISKGKLKNFNAKKGKDNFLSTWNQYTAPHDLIGGFQIGLNPALKPINEGDADYRPGSAEGMVYIMFGDNSLLGGKNNVKGNRSYWFPLFNATVKIDDTTIVKDGKLMIE